jgi:hypothetical protein
MMFLEIGCHGCHLVEDTLGNEAAVDQLSKIHENYLINTQKYVLSAIS